ncbi:hypothetical protein ACJX0J_009817 [Zea mays]
MFFETTIGFAHNSKKLYLFNLTSTCDIAENFASGTSDAQHNVMEILIIAGSTWILCLLPEFSCITFLNYVLPKNLVVINVTKNLLHIYPSSILIVIYDQEILILWQELKQTQKQQIIL